VLDRGDENLSVTDLAGLGGLHDCFDGLVDKSPGNNDFDFDFGQEAHGVFGAAIDFGVTLLATVTFDLGNGHALETDVGQVRPHLLELEGLDDGSDEFHEQHPLVFGLALNIGARDLRVAAGKNPAAIQKGVVKRRANSEIGLVIDFIEI
jgi:hypothetical protein